MIHIKFKYIFLLIIFINIFTVNVYSYDINNVYGDKIKIGIYKNEPYAYVDEQGNVSGYYPEFINILQKKYNFEYEYVICNFADGLKMLEDSEIDIMFGVAITNKRKDKIIFNKYRVSLETHSIATNLDIDVGDLDKLEGLRLGLIREAANSEWFLNLLDSRGITIIPVYDDNFDDLEELLAKDEIDVMVSDKVDSAEYNIIYKFDGSQVYIAGNKNNTNLLNNIDKVIEELEHKENSEISQLYEKYFGNNKSSKFMKSIIIDSIFLIIILLFMIPKFKMKKIRNKIKQRLINNSYFLNYQPIYNPRNNEIVGFESLLRLKENNKIIAPYEFIPEIEKANMLYDVSLWILNQIIKDYEKIKDFKCVKGKDFYISINLSLNEIENKSFVSNAIKILSNSKLGPNKISLEIIERVKINDLDKITTYITELKNSGFKIAIDDFGVEYSNLDVIRKLDFDIIKVDKYFIDAICHDEVQREIVLFINKIACFTKKSIVLEGVEHINQHNMIKSINNENLYVQGYLYNRPMSIEYIQKI